jgi:hypothetical protein
MRNGVWRVASLALVAALISATAFAQGGSSTSSLAGVVVDKDGGVVPGAIVEVKNNATAEKVVVTTNTAGAWSVPSLAIGTYTVTVSLQGFKTWVANDVRLLAAQPGNLKTTLEIGALSETIVVKGNTDLVQTQKATVTDTVKGEAIAGMPIVSRNTLNFVTFLPGVETPGTNRASTINGLPQSAINITINGVSTSNALQSNDGFFSMVTPRLDAIEEVSLTGAAAGADQAGQGSIQIKFVTKSGTNTFSGTGYNYLRHPSLNTNNWFNKNVTGLDRNRVIVEQWGASQGGPIVIPGLVDGRGKAFFFFNFEHFHQPNEISRTRAILNDSAAAGVFTYNTSAGLRTVDILALAGQNGQITAIDPTIASIISRINAAVATQGVTQLPTNNFNSLNYIYQASAKGDQYSPTQKVDINLSSRHRLSGSYLLQRFKSNPDLLNNVEPPFPGFPNFGQQNSYRTTGSISLRSTLGSGMVNEVLGGWQSSPNQFFTNVNAEMFAQDGGFALVLPGVYTNPFSTRNKAPRNTPNWNIDNTMNWLKGKHSFTFGGTFTQTINTTNTQNVVPQITLGFDTTNDPARTLFSTAFFPGASAAQLTEARGIYAYLTGRVTTIAGTPNLNAAGTEYVYNGNLQQRSKMSNFGAFVQDSWRLTPTLTINAGVRWDLQLPFSPITSNFTMSTLEDLCGPSGFGNGPGGRACNMFNPNSFNNPGQIPTYVAYNPGDPGYNTRYTDFGPNVGVAWRPNVQDGLLRKILGDPEQATLRGGFSMTFNRPRMDAFTGLFGANPGATAPGGATRGLAAGNFSLYEGGSTPLLYSERSRLGPPQFVRTPTFPITASLTAGNDISIFDPDIKTPLTRSWSAGFQRSLGRDTAIELRYTGNHSPNAWTTENWNQENVFENGFLQEFQLAQANLAANVAAGRGGTFAFFGPGTGTSPLPTYLAFFSGVPTALAGEAARYTSTNFTNATFVNQLDPYDPQPGTGGTGAAASLWTGSSGAFRANAIAAGLPSNFFVVNPLVDDANVTRSVAFSSYHAGTIDIRRRLSRGLTVNANYTYSRRFGSSLQDLHRDRFTLRQTGVPHALKTTFLYEIPVGRGKRFGTNLGSWMDAVVGGWEVSGTSRIQVNNFVFRGQIVGMSVEDLHDAFKIRFQRNATTGTLEVFSMAQDIIDESRKAFDTDPTSPTGYGAEGPPSGRFLAPAGGPGCNNLFTGDCGEKEFFVNGPKFVRLDLSFKKKFAFARTKSFILQFDLLNAFDNINFTHQFTPGGTWRVTAAFTDPNGTQDPGGRLGQIVWRINW